ncbi:MAG: hypothetical protein ABFR36_10545 [Acidobacteriota bacterium]
MRKNILILIIVLVVPLLYSQEEKKTMNNGDMSFKVEIIRYYFGRENIRVVVTPERLIYETAISLNKKDYTLETRVLTEEESSGLKEFLSEFPLDEFKESYYNKGVKDGMQIRFTININGIEKNIYVANYYIKELAELVSEVVKLCPEDHLCYNSDSVSEVIEK